MNKPTIYLAGPISGTSYGECTDWRDYVTTELEPDIISFSPMRHKSYLHGETQIGDSYENHVMSSQRGIFARDSYDCSRVDALFVNLLGATRVSIGTVMEIAWGHAHRKPIVLVMEDWINDKHNIHEHAMIKEACPFRVPTINEGVSVIKRLLLP